MGQSKVVRDLGVQVPEPGELGRPDPNRVALEQQADAPLPAQHGQDLRITSSTPGMARRVCRAARSAGCSHEAAAISGKRLRGRGAEAGGHA